LRILTERLELVAADPRLARALASDQAEMGRLLGVRVPPEWPPELMVHALEFLAQATERAPDAVGWWVWLIVLPADRVLIGSIGFKGPPDADGRVDIGYSVLDAWQRRGYASEAVGALVDWALADARVTHIIGETFPHLTASIRVLEKSGFRYVGVGVGHEGEPEVLQFERRRV
jgi:[ribosomal protein S5]-alanine N-acetyltransferase